MKNFIKRIKQKFMSPNEYAKSIGVKMGKGCYISTTELPSEGFLIELGDYVRIANHASLYTHGSIYSLRIYYNNPTLDYFGKIKIGSYSHIGAYAMIMPGVTIGERCVVGGGSVVTKSVPDGCMVAGNPARIIGHTDEFYKRINENFNLTCKGISETEKIKYLMSLPDENFVQKGYLKEK